MRGDEMNFEDCLEINSFDTREDGSKRSIRSRKNNNTPGDRERDLEELRQDSGVRQKGKTKP